SPLLALTRVGLGLGPGMALALGGHWLRLRLRLGSAFFVATPCVSCVLFVATRCVSETHKALTHSLPYLSRYWRSICERSFRPNRVSLGSFPLANTAIFRASARCTASSECSSQSCTKNRHVF